MRSPCGWICSMEEITKTPRDRERATRLLSDGGVPRETLHKAGSGTRWAS